MLPWQQIEISGFTKLLKLKLEGKYGDMLP